MKKITHIFSFLSLRTSVSSVVHLTLLTLLSSFMLLPLQAQELLVGTLPGEVEVDNTGNATYRIPLDLPPGTGGLEPTLFLQYRSNGSNGPLGVAWSLGGLSVIERGPTTKVHDGFIDPVDFDMNDRFLLDGQRLMLVDSLDGTVTGELENYGLPGSEYRTEVESFKRVVAYGQTGNGPAYFEVRTKSGLVMEYGNTADSFIEAQGESEALTWALNKVTDSTGNYMTFTYDKNSDPEIGEYRIQHIDYTGNSTTGLLPYNRIEFKYEDRVDTTPGYINGSRLQVTQRLERVTMLSEGEHVRDYRLEYAYSHNSGMSLLQSVQQFTTGTEGVKTFPKTIFEWQESFDIGSDALFSERPIEGKYFGDYVTPYATDIDGDGKSELAILHTNGSFSQFNNHRLVENPETGSYDLKYINKLYLSEQSSHRGNTNFNISFSDYNGDGLSDFGLSSRRIGGKNVYMYASIRYSNGVDQFDDRVHLRSYSSKKQSRHVKYFSDSADFDGDGKGEFMEIAKYGKNQPHIVEVANDNNRFDTWLDLSSLGGHPVLSRARYHVGDFNGDGMADLGLEYRSSNQTRLAIYYSTGSSFESGFNEIIDSNWSRDDRSLSFDVNADGLPDLTRIIKDEDQTRMKILVNNGVMFNEETDFVIDSNRWNKKDREIPVDIDGDGSIDLVRYYENSDAEKTQVEVWKNRFGNFGTAPVVSYEFDKWNEKNSLAPIDIDGDGLSDFVYIWRDGSRYRFTVYKNNGVKPDLITKVTKGYKAENDHGDVTELTYKPITDEGIYQKGTGAEFPVVDVQTPQYVVASQGKSDGFGGIYYTDYTYANARTHLTGRGFLGFQIFESYDRRTQLSRVEVLAQDFPHIGMSQRTESYYTPDPSQPGERILLSRASNTLLFDQVLNGTRFPYIPQSVEEKWEFRETIDNPLNLPAPFTTVTTNNWFDNQDHNVSQPETQPNELPNKITEGNITQVTIDYGDGVSKQTTMSEYYPADWNDWFLGRLKKTTVKHEVPSYPDETRTTSFDYDSVTGLLLKETVEPGHAELELVTTHIRDDYGNIRETQVSGPGITTRTTVKNTEMDPKFRFVTRSENTLGHAETFEYDHRLGVMLKQTGPNGLSTEWQYNPFGRVLLETRADGTTTQNTYVWDNTTMVLNPLSNIEQPAFYKVITKVSGQPETITYYDRLARELRAETTGGNGQQVYRDTAYNLLGQVDCISEPYFVGDRQYWGYTEYDPLGRMKRVTSTDGTVTEYRHNGLSETQISNVSQGESDPSYNQTRTSIKNIKGQVIRVIDNDGKSLRFEYDAVGNQVKAIDVAGNETSITYDIRGNKINMDDPDMGQWSYDYNTLGELVSQTDAKGQTITMAYDLLGRQTSSTNLEGTRTWEYDDASEHGWLGALKQENGPDGYKKVYYYDDLGRLFVTLYHIDEKWYYTETTYDDFSRVESVSRYWRPKELHGGEDQLHYLWRSFGTVINYNEHGFTQSVTDSLGHTWWDSQDDFDAHGRAVSYTYGNGIVTKDFYSPKTQLLRSREAGMGGGNGLQDLHFTFNRIGHLIEYEDQGKDLSETFAYDNLNRLVSSQVKSQSIKRMSYDGLGNIISKTGLAGNYIYGENGAGPHAVTAADGVNYTYDGNGNMISRGSDTVTWTSFNKPLSISRGENATEFTYDANNNRITQTITEGGSKRKKIYVGGALEQEESYDEDVEEPWELLRTRIFISTPVGTVGIYTEEAEEKKREYFHKDHLGTIVSVTDEVGAIEEEYSYDCWGKRRNAVDWSDNFAPQESYATDRGFTGHEMLDAVGLVHMNGRIYDGHLGRFLSADTFVQFESDMQSYNRYSYVLNNPLSYSDPSGHFVATLIAVAIGAAIFAGGATLQAAIIATIIAGIVIATYQGYRAGGMQGALRAFAFSVAVAAVSYGIGVGFDQLAAGLAGAQLFLVETARATTHGIAQGAFTELAGGDFVAGFAAGFASSALGSFMEFHMNQEGGSWIGSKGDWQDGSFKIVGRTAAAAIVGGTASELGGGKFANGAISGAVVHLFNSEGLLTTIYKSIKSNTEQVKARINQFVDKKVNEGVEALKTRIERAPDDLIISAAKAGHTEKGVVLGKHKIDVSVGLKVNRGIFRSIQYETKLSVTGQAVLTADVNFSLSVDNSLLVTIKPDTTGILEFNTSHSAFGREIYRSNVERTYFRSSPEVKFKR